MCIRDSILEVAVGRCERDDERELKLGELYTEWHGGHGSATSMNLVTVPASLADELTALRTRYAFTGLSFHGCELSSLPREFARAAPWLTSLSLGYNPIEELPEVILALDNDQAGRNAQRLLHHHLDGHTPVRALRLPDGADLTDTYRRTQCTNTPSNSATPSIN